MVLVEVEDPGGARGFGEVWCNFPAVGTEHRARIIDGVLAPLLLTRPDESPSTAFDLNRARTRSESPRRCRAFLHPQMPRSRPSPYFDQDHYFAARWF
jgi:hypothetical protein